MDRNKLLQMLDAGFRRFYSEGHFKWNKKEVIAAINPLGENHEINDPKIQNILKELEEKGLITLKHQDEFYLEVLHD